MVDEKELNELIEKEFRKLDSDNHITKIKAFLLDNRNDNKVCYYLILNLRLQIINAIINYGKKLNEKIILREKINIYVNFLFQLVEDEKFDDMVKSDLIFSLGMIGKAQYKQKFDTNDDFIFKKLKEILLSNSSESLNYTIASIFWHFAKVGLSDYQLDEIKELHNQSTGSVKDLLWGALIIGGIDMDKNN